MTNDYPKKKRRQRIIDSYQANLMDIEREIRPLLDERLGIKRECFHKGIPVLNSEGRIGACREIMECYPDGLRVRDIYEILKGEEWEIGPMTRQGHRLYHRLRLELGRHARNGTGHIRRIAVGVYVINRLRELECYGKSKRKD